MPGKDFFDRQRARQMMSQQGRSAEAAAAMARLAGTEEPKDRFGQPIRVGDLVVYRPPQDDVFQIVEVQRTSAVNPTAPPGIVTIVLSATFPVHANVLQRIGNMIRCGHVQGEAEAAAMQAEANGSEHESLADEPPLPPNGLFAEDKPAAEPSPASGQDAPRVTLTD